MGGARSKSLLALLAAVIGLGLWFGCSSDDPLATPIPGTGGLGGHAQDSSLDSSDASFENGLGGKGGNAQGGASGAGGSIVGGAAGSSGTGGQGGTSAGGSAGIGGAAGLAGSGGSGGSGGASNITATGPTVVVPHATILSNIGTLPDAPMAMFQYKGVRYWTITSDLGHVLGTGSLDGPFDTVLWKARPQDLLFTNPQELDVLKDDGTLKGVAWLVNAYQTADGILALIHVESYVWDDVTYFSSGSGYCKLPKATQLFNIPQYTSLPASQTNQGTCLVPTTIPAGDFIVGGRRYYSSGSAFCRYRASGLNHGIKVYADLPTGLNNSGDCVPSAPPAVIPAGLFNVNDDQTYYSNGTAFCRYTRTTVGAGIASYSGLPSGMADHGDCGPPASIPDGDFLAGGNRYRKSGGSYCRYQSDGSTAGLTVYSDFAPGMQHAGQCVSSVPPSPTGTFNVGFTTTRWAGRLGLAWSTDGGTTYRYLGHILTPSQDPSDQGNMNVHGAPYLIQGDNLYVYYEDGYRPAVARAQLSTVLADAKKGTVGTWNKYYNGTWTEPGHGGQVTKLDGLEGVIHTDAAYSTHTDRYYITISWPGGDPNVQPAFPGKIRLLESSDLVHWTERFTVAYDPISTPKHGYQYVTIVNEDGTDNGVVGRKFYVYAFRDYWDKDVNVGHRWLVDLGP